MENWAGYTNSLFARRQMYVRRYRGFVSVCRFIEQMLKRYNIAPPGLYNRQLRGRYLFTPVVVVSGSDHAHIYVAGKTSIQPDGTIGGVGDLRAQIGFVCQAIRTSVEYVGASLDDVVRTVTYVRDIDAYYAVAEERYRYSTMLCRPIRLSRSAAWPILT